MATYNKAILMGHLTADPKLGTLPNTGDAVCEFGLAVNSRYKDKSGMPQDDVLFIDCIVYRKNAERIGQTLKKGSPIHVEGRLKLDRWDQDGHHRSKIRLIVQQFQFVGSKPASNPAAKSRASRPTRESKSVGHSPRTASAPT